MNYLYNLFFSALPSASSAFGNINSLDVKKAFRFAAVGAVGYFISTLVQELASLDFGTAKPIMDIVFMGLTELGRRLLATTPAE